MTREQLTHTTMYLRNNYLIGIIHLNITAPDRLIQPDHIKQLTQSHHHMFHRVYRGQMIHQMSR